LKNVKSPYLSEKSSDFDEIWYTTADIEPDESRDQNLFFKFKMADGRHVENRFLSHMAYLVTPLSDFSEILYDKAEWHADNSHVIKTDNFKNPRWRTAAILQVSIVNWHLIKFPR